MEKTGVTIMREIRKFTIKLRGDLCVSNGEGFGSVIDTDVSYDKYGLPVIRGKSLKGCLLEIAEELTDAGILTENFKKKVFGESGQEKEGNLIINDAHLEKYDEYLNDIRAMEPKPSVDQVISCFAYTRGQTAIATAEDEKNSEKFHEGVAKENSLRTIRVLRRGLRFECEYSLDNDSDYQKNVTNFEKCIKLLRRIGMNRTRGLGEVECTPDDTALEKIVTHNKADSIKGCGYLRYTFETLSPLIATKDNENREYIPGSTMEGLCFRNIGKDKMISWIDNDLRFTNALISDDKGNRYATAPAFLAKQKVPEKNKYGVNGTRHFVFDTKACENADPPAMQVKNMNVWISDDFSTLRSMSNEYEINYHHQQSQDNPGIIDGENFYQLSSLAEGQFFTGKIYGDEKALAEIYDSFGDEQIVNIGYYRSGGYGKCRLTIEPVVEERKQKSAKKIAVWLAAPAILYDDYGMPCAKPKVFEAYFKELPEFKELNPMLCEKHQNDRNNNEKPGKLMYLRYTTIGGYNATWKLNKQRFQAYDAGTCFVFELNDNVDLSKLSGVFIGERTAEGFGELIVYDYDVIINASDKIYVESYSSEPYIKDNKIKISEDEDLVSKQLETRRFKEKIKLLALQHEPMIKGWFNASQLGRLALMCDESNCFDSDDKKKVVNNEPIKSFKSFIASIKSGEQSKKKFKEKANDLFDIVKSNKFKVEDVELMDKIKTGAYYKLYYSTLLTAAKYSLRNDEGKGE